MVENIIELLCYFLIALSIVLIPIAFVLLAIESKGIKVKIKSKEKKVKYENTREILVKRYINGEITKEQFEERKKDLE